MAEILEKETGTVDMSNVPSMAKANAGLTLGIIGTALAAFSGAGALGGLFGNRGSNGNNYVTKDALYDVEKEATRHYYRNRLDLMASVSDLRQADNDNTFMLYKNQRDSYDLLTNRISDLEKEVAVNTAVRPYQDALLNAKIDGVAMNSGWALQLGLSNCIKGVVTLPDLPISGLPSYTGTLVSNGTAATGTSTTNQTTQNNG